MLAMFENHWRAALVLMERFDLGPQVRESVQQTFERWDGKGEPDGAQGEEIAIASRRLGGARALDRKDIPSRSLPTGTRA